MIAVALFSLLALFPADPARASGGACRSVMGEALIGSGLSVHESASGHKIAYRRSGPPGAGTVVVFLNGIDKDQGQWNEVRDRLAREKSDLGFLQLDLLGQGKTSELTPWSGNSIPFAEQVRFLREILEKEGLRGRTLVLAGHSYGGGIAIRFMREHPGWVKDVVLIAPFVDHLETYQPVVGPALWWTKMWSEMWGFKEWYDFNVLYGSDAATIALWPLYAYWHQSGGNLRDMLALGRGIRDLRMADSIAQAGETRVHMAVAMADEMIPYLAHVRLWNAVPKSNRGTFSHLATTHEALQQSPSAVALAILDAVR